jgi:hypothetical protein
MNKLKVKLPPHVKYENGAFVVVYTEAELQAKWDQLKKSIKDIEDKSNQPE